MVRLSFSPDLRGQGAVDYLRTYWWALIVLFVVLVIFSKLGVFLSSNFITTQCIPNSGYVCQNLLMNTTGYVSFSMGLVNNGTISIVGLACTNSTEQPSSWSAEGIKIFGGHSINMTAHCPGVVQNTLGAPFKGYLWIKYDVGEQSGTVQNLAFITVSASTQAPLPSPNPLNASIGATSTI